MTNVAGNVRNGAGIRLHTFTVIAAAASEVLSIGPYSVLGCFYVYEVAGAPTAPVWVHDPVAKTVTISGHQLGSTFSVQVMTA